MATKLLKQVERETTHTTTRKGKVLVVTLLPGDVIEFRAKGSRRRLVLSLGHAYTLATVIDAEVRYKSAVSEWTKKKKAGYKNLRRPKKAAYPFSLLFFKALKN